tara:strand:- start:1815 stop:2420 length:606 start_codon:yes stop_codon:yes gene_type:complete
VRKKSFPPHKKKIGVIPTIYEKRGSLNILVDLKIFEFLNYCFGKHEIIILDKYYNAKLDLIVSLGGNTLYRLVKNRSNSLRKKLDKYYLNKSINKKIPFLGICHGAQFIGSFFNGKLIKKKGHTNVQHKIILKSKKTLEVNSFHDYSIASIGKQFEVLAKAEDGTIEAFKHKKYRLLGIIWHPERYKKFKKFDLEFIKKNL